MTERSRFNMQDKVAIITGSAGGIGKAIATLFASNGARVVVSDVQQEAGVKTAQDLGGVFIPCDVSDIDQVNHLIDEAVSRFGRLDVMAVSYTHLTLPTILRV